MITVRKTDDELVIEGHAVQDKRFSCIESNLACGAMSGITQTMVNGILCLTGCSPEYEMRTGYTRLDLTSLNDKAMLLVDTFMLGAKAIAQANTDYIEVIENDFI